MDYLLRPQTALRAQFGDDVTLVVYVRDQPAAINAAYVESVISFGFGGSLWDATKRYITSGAFHYARWFDLAAANGATLIVRPYSTRVVSDFWSVLGLPAPSEPNVNRSAGPSAVAAALAFAGGRNVSLPEAIEANNLLKASARPERPFFGFSRAEVERLRGYFAPHNVALAERAWGGPWPIEAAPEVNTQPDPGEVARLARQFADLQSRYASEPLYQNVAVSNSSRVKSAPQ
jgi:hypothetical protein